jgi:hypothetical protein
VIAVAIEAETAAESAVGIAIVAVVAVVATVAAVAVVAVVATVAVVAVVAAVAIVVSAVKGAVVIATTDHREPKSGPRTASLQCPPSPWSLREPPRAK